MTPLELSETRQLLEGAVAAFSILGGAMAYVSGFLAAQALAEDQRSEVVAQRVNEGIGLGFIWGSPLALLTLIIVVWN